MKYYDKNDLRVAFAMGIDFAVVNKDIIEDRDGKFRDMGFNDAIKQIKGNYDNKERSIDSQVYGDGPGGQF